MSSRIRPARYPLPLLLLSLAACDCSARSPQGDAGGEAGVDSGRGRTPADAWRDAARDASHDAAGAVDASADAGLLGFPEGWEQVPFMPEACDAWRPRGEASTVIPPLRFVPCDPPEPACEELVTDWERGRIGYNMLVPMDLRGGQTWGETDLIAFGLPFRLGRVDYTTWTLYRLDGTPVAAWRMRPVVGTMCFADAIAVVGDRIAISFSSSLSGQPLEVQVIADRIDAIQRADHPMLRVGESQLGSPGNSPDELIWDGESMVVRGTIGSIYLGWMAGRPFEGIATARTGDWGAYSGLLFGGDFYFVASPWEAPRGQSLRRRRRGAARNETFMAPEGGDYLGVFRVNETWVTWARRVAVLPDYDFVRTDILAARTGGSMDPTSWTPRVIARLPFPNALALCRPILSGGMLVYLVDWPAKHMELIDLGRMRRWRMQISRRRHSLTALLHLGPEWLYVVTSAGDAPWEGLHRYRVADLEGWAPIE